jgi:hypothetical protein
LPDELIADLTTLETLDKEALWQVMKETVPSETQAELSDLLERRQQYSLTPLTNDEQERLVSLQQEADLVMLRKAQPFLRLGIDCELSSRQVSFDALG